MSLYVFAGTLLSAALVSAPPLRAATLRDGTPVQVRLEGVIDSERSKAGDAIVFVVTRDVIVDGQVLIARGARVAGRIARAQSASHGFTSRSAKLAFVFTRATAWDGEVIRLRSSPTRRRDASVVINRTRHGHDLEWVSNADYFEAYVEGDYEL
jgi:hypothetical protein